MSHRVFMHLLYQQIVFILKSFQPIIKSALIWVTIGFNPQLRIRLLIWEREEGSRERERQTETSIGCLHMHPDHQGSNPQPRYKPWPGIRPATFRCTGKFWAQSTALHQLGLIHREFCCDPLIRSKDNRVIKYYSMFFPKIFTLSNGQNALSILKYSRFLFFTF